MYRGEIIVFSSDVGGK